MKPFKSICLTFVCLLMISLAAHAQQPQGKYLRIVYNTKYNTRKNIKPKYDLQYLEITDSISYFYSYYDWRTREVEDSLNRRGNFDISLRAKLSQPYATGQLYRIHKGEPRRNFLTGLVIDIDAFKYVEELPDFKWKILNRDSTIAGYPCQQATTRFRGRIWNVWFTPDIPVSDGPWKFCGLPGLILKAEDTDHYFDFECAGIQHIDHCNAKSNSRFKYQECTPQEYFKTLKEIKSNPIGYIRMRNSGQSGEEDDIQRKTDIRNKPEELAKIIYIEDYDAAEEK